MEAVDQQSARTAPLVFTDVAAAKVGELIVEEGNSALMLRIFVLGLEYRCVPRAILKSAGRVIYIGLYLAGSIDLNEGNRDAH